MSQITDALKQLDRAIENQMSEFMIIGKQLQNAVIEDNKEKANQHKERMISLWHELIPVQNILEKRYVHLVPLFKSLSKEIDAKDSLLNCMSEIKY